MKESPGRRISQKESGEEETRRMVSENQEEKNYMYLLRCADGTFYCGWTNHLEARVEAHNAGKGAKYTRSRLPVELVYREALGDKSAALRREREIKKLTRAQKLALIAAQNRGTGAEAESIRG